MLANSARAPNTIFASKLVVGFLRGVELHFLVRDSWEGALLWSVSFEALVEFAPILGLELGLSVEVAAIFIILSLSVLHFLIWVEGDTETCILSFGLSGRLLRNNRRNA